MAKRFGRNQRRQLREQITSLATIVDQLRFGTWAKAQPGDIMLEQLGVIGGWRRIDEKVEKYAGGYDKLTVEATLYPKTDEIRRVLYDRDPVSWCGLQWRVEQVHVTDPWLDMGRNGGDCRDANRCGIPQVDLELHAIGARNQRGATLWPTHFSNEMLQEMVRAKESANDAKHWMNLYQGSWMESH